jgi:CheY-like chemotaxis protein
MTTMAEEKNKILVVEDDLFLLKAISRFIDQHGYTALKAENGLDALNIIKKEHPALIISDLNMPVMDGFGLLERLAFEAPQTPVIILSGVGDKPDVIQAFRAGAWDYVTKPIEDIDAFIDKIGTTLMKAEMGYDYSAERENFLEKEAAESEQSGANTGEPGNKSGDDKQELVRIIDSLQESVALINKNHSLVRVNKTMATLFNCDRNELVGSTKYLSTNGFNNREQATDNFQSVFLGQKVSGTFFDEAKQATFEVDMCPYYDVDDTTVVGCVYTARDITNRNDEPSP